jgi:hypothetical protein
MKNEVLKTLKDEFQEIGFTGGSIRSWLFTQRFIGNLTVFRR